MDCSIENCEFEIISLCENCSPPVPFCKNHAIDHINEIGHFPRSATHQEIQYAQSKFVKVKTASIISQIIKISSEIISEVVTVSQKAIQSVKKNKKNLELFTSTISNQIDIGFYDEIKTSIRGLFNIDIDHENIDDSEYSTFKETEYHFGIYNPAISNHLGPSFGSGAPCMGRGMGSHCDGCRFKYSSLVPYSNMGNPGIGMPNPGMGIGNPGMGIGNQGMGMPIP